MAIDFSVHKVRVTGMSYLGLRDVIRTSPETIARFKREGVGVTYTTSLGEIRGRLDDLRGVDLRSPLNPTAFEQSFVSARITETAGNLISATPELLARVTASAAPVDFENLSFKLTPTDAMFYQTVHAGEIWQPAELVAYDRFLMSPASGVDNYGQGIFEGMKANRSAQGNVVLFRPHENAIRMQDGAKRLEMTPVPTEYFLDAVEQVVKANERWIPPMGKGSLYIRPLLIGSGPVLGVSPAPENTFMVYASPVGPYFKGGQTAIKLLVADPYHRAAPGGSGGVKAIGNYAPGMKPAKEAKAQHFAEVIYLDAKENRFIEEVGAANFFMVKDGILYTPKLTGTILPGITRDSVLSLARKIGMKISQMKVAIDFALTADEAFCTGTAAVISPIGSITHGDRTETFGNGQVGPVTKQLYNTLTALQEERIPDPFGWVHKVL